MKVFKNLTVRRLVKNDKFKFKLNDKILYKIFPS